jgi:putative phosphoesterase
MKIAVFTDVHANFPALKAALKAITREGSDLIFHIGDAIAIGPSPAECIDLLLNTPNIQFVAGNHDRYFVDGLPYPQPEWMDDGEVHHQQWTHEQLNSHQKSLMAQWPYLFNDEFDGVKTTFLHYGLTASRQDFMPIIRQPTVSDLNNMFEPYDSHLTFYGHTHIFSDVQGTGRYVNPGSLGCARDAIARYCMAEFKRGMFTISHHQVPYDDSELFTVFEQRQVPERQFLYQAFFGGRCPG